MSEVEHLGVRATPHLECPVLGDGGSPKIGAYDDLVGEFRRRFPLFERVDGRFGEGAPSECIPWFFGYIVAAATKPGSGACCFVLDKTPGTTVIAAVLSGLGRLQLDFPDLVESYVRNALTRGQRVKVKPSDFVYEYEGVWDEFPHLFKLRLLGEDAWRGFPRDDVLRLEPTDRVQPKGTGSDLGAFERSPLDRLLGLTTCGNNSVIRNVVLVQMPRAQLARIVDVTTLAPKGAEESASLSGCLPWGFIGQDGTLNPNDAYQVVGEPLIAATSVPEDLALACNRADAGTKAVLVDGARRLARDLQAFDDISERQRLVVLASLDESEDLELLKDRGCPVWHMSAEEVLIGEVCADSRDRTSLAGATIRAADVRRRCRVDVIECSDELLQAAAASLERGAEMIVDRDDAPDVEVALGRLFGVLFEFSECCFDIGEDTKRTLQTACEELARQERWLEPAVASQFHDAVTALERAVTNGSGAGKADALLDILDSDGRWAVAARSPRTAEKLQEDLVALGADVPVVAISAVRPDDEFDGIVVPAWPNERRFARLKNLSVTPRIRILAYTFEHKWVARHQVRERARSRSNRLDAEQLSPILGIAPRLLSPREGPKDEVADPPGKEVPLDLPVFRIEERIARRHAIRPSLAASGEDSRQAQLVQFLGGCYALLTEWSELPVLNDLINSREGDHSKLTSAVASSLSPGDFVLFRAAGDKEFTRMIAEEVPWTRRVLARPHGRRAVEVCASPPWRPAINYPTAFGGARA